MLNPRAKLSGSHSRSFARLARYGFVEPPLGPFFALFDIRLQKIASHEQGPFQQAPAATAQLIRC